MAQLNFGSVYGAGAGQTQHNVPTSTEGWDTDTWRANQSSARSSYGQLIETEKPERVFSASCTAQQPTVNAQSSILRSRAQGTQNNAPNFAVASASAHASATTLNSCIIAAPYLNNIPLPLPFTTSSPCRRCAAAGSRGAIAVSAVAWPPLPALSGPRPLVKLTLPVAEPLTGSTVGATTPPDSE